MKFRIARSRGVIAAGLTLAIGAAAAAADMPAKTDIESQLGLQDSIPFLLDGPLPVGEFMRITLPIEGGLTIEIAPYSVRSEHYAVYAAQADGTLVKQQPGPVNTLRGFVDGEIETRITAGIIDGGLHAMIDRPGQERLWIEPLGRKFPDHPLAHVAYSDSDVLPHEGRCDMSHVANAGFGAMDAPADPGSPTQGALGTCITELATDADFQYFQDWGGNTENRINTVINTMNAQYESEVGITHQITAVIIRESQVYTSTDAGTLLGQFRSRWLSQHAGIQRDVAKLFTGKSLQGSTIGIAWGIGEICTSGAYCLSESDFNGNFGCATDLAAHELGHLWNGSHCSCPGFTMNPTITCANQFSSVTIPDIEAHRNSRPCLECIPPDEYCEPSASITTAEHISNVQINTIDNSSDGQGYQDFTNISTNVEQGSLYELRVTLSGGFDTDIGAAWVDWNNDLDFDDFFETINDNWSGAGPLFTADVNVFNAFQLGAHRMRIRFQRNINPIVDPCGNTLTGESEDYTLFVVEEAADCPTDLDGNGATDFNDLITLLAAWGTPNGDVDGNGTTDFSDLVTLLAAWGPCE